MTVIDLLDHPRHTDHVRLRDGRVLTIRLVTPGDGDALQRYFRLLSVRSRYNRFLGAVSELPASQLDQFVHAGRDNRFSVIAVRMIEGREIIVGEARYGFDPVKKSFEFGVSIDDRWQGEGIGSALLANLECRAAALGATSMFGDTLRSNEAMIALARKSGFAFGRHPDDWKLVRFERPIDPIHQDIPCADWKLVAAQRMAEAVV
jgi:RimJ/RimL family protein N-acetyltransferase